MVAMKGVRNWRKYKGCRVLEMPSKIVDNRRVPVLIPNTEIMMVPSGDT